MRSLIRLAVCPIGPAVPPAVAASECGSASSAQTPAATQDVLMSPPSRKRVHSKSVGASDGDKRGSAQHAQASTSNSSEATAAVLVSPPSRKRVHSEGAGASDGGKALSSSVVSIKVRRSSRSKKTTASPGDHSCGACPVSISDFSSYGMLRHEQDHQHQATNKYRVYNNNSAESMSAKCVNTRL